MKNIKTEQLVGRPFFGNLVSGDTFGSFTIIGNYKRKWQAESIALQASNRMAMEGYIHGLFPRGWIVYKETAKILASAKYVRFELQYELEKGWTILARWKGDSLEDARTYFKDRMRVYRKDQAALKGIVSMPAYKGKHRIVRCECEIVEVIQ